MHYIEDACIEIGKNMKPGTFISLESTTYPTTTEEFMLPIIEKESGLKHGTDFWLAYSPERVDPGNQNFHTKNTPKVIGAMSDEGLEIGMKLYSRAIDTLHPVSSPRVAKMVKILENTYRLVNISLINELALLAGKMDIVARKGSDIKYHDPHIAKVRTPEGSQLQSLQLNEETLANADLVVLTMNHAAFDVEFIQKHARLIVDLRNMIKESGDNVYKL